MNVVDGLDPSKIPYNMWTINPELQPFLYTVLQPYFPIQCVVPELIQMGN